MVLERGLVEGAPARLVHRPFGRAERLQPARQQLARRRAPGRRSAPARAPARRPRRPAPGSGRRPRRARDGTGRRWLRPPDTAAGRGRSAARRGETRRPRRHRGERRRGPRDLERPPVERVALHVDRDQRRALEVRGGVERPSRTRRCAAAPSPRPPRPWIAWPMFPSAWVNSDGITKILFAGALCELRQHLQVLVAEQLLVGAALVDRLEHRLDRLRLALGSQDRRGLARPRR